jgi:hypothetical protein
MGCNFHSNANTSQMGDAAISEDSPELHLGMFDFLEHPWLKEARGICASERSLYAQKVFFYHLCRTDFRN